MAVEFSVAHSRKTEYLIDPALIVVKPQLNGRVELPDISWLVESMVALGQRVPVEVRNEGGKPVLVSVHSRWRAAVEINKKKLTKGKFLLRCVYSRCNDAYRHSGFLLSVSLCASADGPDLEAGVRGLYLRGSGEISMPCRSNIFSWRCSGWWSAQGAVSWGSWTKYLESHARRALCGRL